MVNAVNYLLTEGLIGESLQNSSLQLETLRLGVPDSIRQLIEKQLVHLNPDKTETLEAASVVGAEFSSLAVVAALGGDRAAVEARCEELALQHQFVKECGVQELPNGEPVTRYGFIHALYRNALYERLSVSRRTQLHRRIGDRGEEIYGEHSSQIAAELAWHFEQGRDYKQAAKFLKLAADNAIRRFAYREAVGLARRGLKLLRRLTASRERDEQELCLQLTLGLPLIATEGYAAPEVGRVYLEAHDLCRELGDTPDVSEVLWGLWSFYIVRAELQKAQNIGGEFLQLAQQRAYPGLAMLGHHATEVTFVHLGELDSAREHFEKALSLYDNERHPQDTFLYSQNPGVAI